MGSVLYRMVPLRIAVVLPQIWNVLDASPSQLGRLVAGFPLGVGVLSVFAGVWVRRLDPRSAIVKDRSFFSAGGLLSAAAGSVPTPTCHAVAGPGRCRQRRSGEGRIAGGEHRPVPAGRRGGMAGVDGHRDRWPDRIRGGNARRRARQLAGHPGWDRPRSPRIRATLQRDLEEGPGPLRATIDCVIEIRAPHLPGWSKGKRVIEHAPEKAAEVIGKERKLTQLGWVAEFFDAAAGSDGK